MANIVLLNVEKKNALLNGKVDLWNTKLKQMMTVKEGSAQLSDSTVRVISTEGISGMVPTLYE